MVDYQVVIGLVKAALDGTPTNIPAEFPLLEYLLFARHQQIEAIMITGLLKSGVKLLREVKNILLQSAVVSSRQVAGAESLFASFRENSIDYLPLKGSVLKPLYPSDELRSMGDIDVLIRVEQYDRIRSLMLAAGFREIVESDHEYIWDKPYVHIELHKRLIPSYNKDYYAYYGDGWRLAKPTDVPFCYTMTHEDTFIYLFTHYAKHYRDAGVGIRQALDLYIYRKAYPDMNEQYMQETLKLLQLERFYANTMHMLDVWFADAEHTEASKLISDRLFDSGVFGTYESSLQSTMLKEANSSGSVGKVKFQKWSRRMFPTFSSLKEHYPALQRWPVLLPFVWVIRCVDTILHQRDLIKKCLKEDEISGKKSVNEYHEMLKKSGLDFNFK